MSFRCGNCDQPQPPRARPKKVVTARRAVTYRSGTEDSLGHEIVTEKMIGPCCDVEDVSIPGGMFGETLRFNPFRS